MNIIKARLIKLAREEDISIWKEHIDESVLFFDEILLDWRYEEDDEAKMKLGNNHFRVNYGVYLHKDGLDNFLKDLFPIEQASKPETKNKLIDDIYNNHNLLEETLKQFFFSNLQLRKIVSQLTDAKQSGLPKNVKFSNESWQKTEGRGLVYGLSIDFDVNLK